MAGALFICFIVLMLAGVPVGFAIGASTLLALVWSGYDQAIYIVPQQVLEGVNSASLLSIPFFILAGNLMNVSGVTDRIFIFASAMVGHFRAGLAQVNVVASMIFAGISGSALADIAGLGAVEIKAMRERGYPAEFAAALTVSTAVLSPMIPPSIAFIVYAWLSSTSVARLFLAGLLPGILLGIVLMIYIRIIAKPQGFPRERRATPRELMRATIYGLPALGAPAIILIGIIEGVTTVTEAGVLACSYSLLLGFFYRTLTLEKLWFAITETTIITSVIMMILGFSAVMSWLLAIEQVPQHVASFVLAATASKMLFLLLLVIFLLIVGCFIESAPAKLILVPVLLPVIDEFGIDRVHFGVILTLALAIGIATPPMGIGIFVATEVSKVPFEKITRALLPQLLPLGIVLLLVTFLPQLSLLLPNLVMGPK